MSKIKFDFKNPDFSLVRQVIFRRLREDSSWDQLDPGGEGFLPYVEMAGNEIGTFAFYAKEVCWQLLCTGVLAPGKNPENPDRPWFHITAFGRLLIQSGEWPANDPAGYIARLKQKIPTPDATVLAYLSEALCSFERGNVIASMVMLGIAAERVFLLLCEATENALTNPSEKKAFSGLLKRFSMKPKLDWLHQKFQALQQKPPAGFPDNAVIMVTAIYDLLRCQRNDLGHPRPMPPSLSPEDAYANLQVFPRYYEIAEVIRGLFASHKI